MKKGHPRGKRNRILENAITCRGDDLDASFGISRTQAYALVKRGEIEAVSLKPEGARSGLRVYLVQSVRDFIERRRQARGLST
jgi:hypothetical protein